uniref:Uncharacterized protein n=1 Tax=Caenorhabditis japonica TaxID=281687 RepID=A0A8R1ESK4_CAEJA
MNPCYERYYEVGAYYIAYWIVNGDMYCEALVNGNPNNYKPPFGQANLFRVEYQKLGVLTISELNDVLNV